MYPGREQYRFSARIFNFITMKNLSIFFVIAIVTVSFRNTSVINDIFFEGENTQETNKILGKQINCSAQTEALKAILFYRTQDHETTLSVPLNLSAGYSAKIYSSSDETVIAKSGVITQQKVFSYVKVVYEVTKDGDPDNKGYTPPINVLVPAKPDPNNCYTGGTYTDDRYGVFFHIFHNCMYSNGERAGGLEEVCENFNAKKVADDVAAMGFQMVVITDFHGYGITLHPNPSVDFYRGEGKYTATHDLLGDLIDELNKRGIQVTLFTHPLDGHDYVNSEHLGWSNGKSSQFQDNQRWNDFINDCYADIAARYGSRVVAIGFDSVLSIDQEPHVPDGIVLDRIRLRKTIKKYAPNVILMSLVGAGANELTDYGLKEIFTPAWIDPSRSIDSIWTEPTKVPASARNTNEYPTYNIATAIVVGDHWLPVASKPQSFPCQYTAEDLFRYSVAQIGVCIGGPATMWAFSPYMDGEWESDKLETFIKVHDYMKPISEALFKTYPSKAFIVRSGKKLKDYEYVSTQSRDNKYQYILVLNPPSGKTITLPAPANGVTFSKAEVITDVNKYQAATLASNDDGYHITIRGSWNSLCTAIRLTVGNVPKVNYALFKPMEVSSSYEPLVDGPTVKDWSRIGKADWSRTFANDGLRLSFDKSWYHDPGSYGWSSMASYTANKTEYIVIDMLKSYSISNVDLYPRTDSGNLGKGFPEEFKIFVSNDAKTWSQVYSKTGQEKPSGLVRCSFTANNARFVKVEATKLGVVENSCFFQLAEIEIYE